ncbi:elongation factor 1-delta-like [Denticeps clupeoides]|uniref:elongation factor 1-delta-like n=1 Tax=Denticeps clupeoides TaxID=299321 RepID=UPI0010A36E8D|nr:elongation factor 1-delta-like [Denticeps clupeoides]
MVSLKASRSDVDQQSSAPLEEGLWAGLRAGLRWECGQVWFERGVYERAESRFHAHGQKVMGCHGNQEERPTTLRPASAGSPVRPSAPGSDQSTPLDEGYLSLTPTPPAAVPRPINGLPRLPAQLLGVWLQKPLYDWAEKSFYENLSSRATPPVTASQSKRENAGRGRCQGASESSQSPRIPKNETSKANVLANERVWLDKVRYDEAERLFYERKTGLQSEDSGANSILEDIARARENIQKSLAGLKTRTRSPGGTSTPSVSRNAPRNAGCPAVDQGDLRARVTRLELENQNLCKVICELRSAFCQLELRVSVLEKKPTTNPTTETLPHTAVTAAVDDDDDDVDLFGSDEEDAEAERIREQRVKEYAERKAKKHAVVAKSSILLDVKPWDDETDMARLEECVRSVRADGLLWGTSRLLPVGYGIRKLQIQCVVEDDKVGTDLLEEEISRFEDYVQSVDVAAFNKI